MSVNIRERLRAEPCDPQTPAERRLFFKYMPFETARIVLASRTLRWTTPGTFNDPFDVQFDFDVRVDDLDGAKRAYTNNFWNKHFSDRPKEGAFWEHVVKESAISVDLALADLRRLLPETNREIRHHMAREKIICLSSTPYSIPMWAYYAEQHTGVVLCFQSVPGADSMWWIAQPIDYREQMPMLYEPDEFIGALNRTFSIDPEEIVRRIVYTKAKAWTHEQEWRIRSGDGRDPHAVHEDFPFGTGELGAVMLGCRMSDERRAEILRLASAYPSAELYEMRKAHKMYELEMTPLAP